MNLKYTLTAVTAAAFALVALAATPSKASVCQGQINWNDCPASMPPNCQNRISVCTTNAGLSNAQVTLYKLAGASSGAANGFTSGGSQLAGCHVQVDSVNPSDTDNAGCSTAATAHYQATY